MSTPDPSVDNPAPLPGGRPKNYRTSRSGAVRQALVGFAGHATAQEIYDAIVRTRGPIGIATVYRQLRTLSDDGIVEVLTTETGRRYRLVDRDLHRHFLICRRCSVTVALDDLDEHWIDRAARRHRFRIVQHSIELTGFCARCQDHLT